MINKKTPKNLEEAYKMGYKATRAAWTRGYVSRKPKADKDIPLYKSKTGDIYYLAPSYNSTNYCHRVYIAK